MSERLQRQRLRRLRRDLLGLELADKGFGRRVQLAHPEVLYHLDHQGALVGDQLGVEGHAALEGMVLQHALTEPVNGKDRRLVEGVQRDEKPGTVLR